MEEENNNLGGEEKLSGSYYNYSVQAKFPHSEPASVNGDLYCDSWKTIQFQAMPDGVGVPSGRYSDKADAEFNLMSYPTAEAMRWWFLSCAYLDGIIGMQTRIVQHESKYSFSHKPISAEDPVTIENNWYKQSDLNKTQD